MEITISPYSSEDAAAAARIWNYVVDEANDFPQEESMSPEEANTFFKAQSYTGIARDGEGRIVGLYILHPNNVGRCGHIANASYAVDHGLRGEHIGEQLVKDCMKMGREKGYRILQFNAVVASNIHAIHLYERLGFTKVGTVPGGFRLRDGSYEDIHIFLHSLTEAEA